MFYFILWKYPYWFYLEPVLPVQNVPFTHYYPIHGITIKFPIQH